MDKMSMQQSGVCNVVRGRSAVEQITPFGKFVIEHWRNGEKIGQYDFSNAITNEGKNKLLNVMFVGTTAITSWYIGFINGSGSPILAATDTYGHINTINGWVEFNAYAETVRQFWVPVASTAQSTTNASPVVININSAGSVFGIFLVGGGTTPAVKNDAAGGGTLWAAAAFASGTVTVGNGDQLKVTYTVGA